MAADLPTPFARVATVNDREALSRFRCSTGPWYEDEVERYIENRLLDSNLRRAPHTGHRVILLETDDHGLVAVGAHEADFLEAPDGQAITGTYLVVGAVAVEHQGATLPNVAPFERESRAPSLGRYLMEALLSDIASGERDPYLRAVIARDNIRSLKLCSRVGLVDERDDDDPRFVQRVGKLAEWDG